MFLINTHASYYNVIGAIAIQNPDTGFNELEVQYLLMFYDLCWSNKI